MANIIRNFKNDYFNEKSIQPSYNFIVEFEKYDVKPFFVKDISIANPSFSKEVIQQGIGVFGFPVMNYSGYDIRMNLEETENFDVRSLIEIFQANVIDSETQTFRDISEFNLGDIYVKVLDNKQKHLGHSIKRSYIFKNCFLLDSGETSFSYESSNPIQYSLTFHANSMEVDLGKEENKKFDNYVKYLNNETNNFSLSLSYSDLKDNTAVQDSTSVSKSINQTE